MKVEKHLSDIFGLFTLGGDDDPAIAFAEAHPEFQLGDPEFVFNEGVVDALVTYWPDAWLKRIS